MPRLFADAAASSNQPAGLSAAATSVQLLSTANFPAPAAGQQFSVVLLDGGNPLFDPNNPLSTPFEYQPVTLNTVGTNTLTFNGGVRGPYAGTTPKSYFSGTKGVIVSAVLLAEDILAAFARIDQANTAALTAAGLISTGGLTIAGHLTSSNYGPAPSFGALQAGISSQNFGAGFNTDNCGLVTLVTTGSPPTAGSPVCVVSFGTTYPAIPKVWVAGQNSGLDLFTQATITTGGFSIYAAANLSPSSTYSIAWQVIG